jgi:hypothetical protein
MSIQLLYFTYMIYIPYLLLQSVFEPEGGSLGPKHVTQFVKFVNKHYVV